MNNLPNGIQHSLDLENLHSFHLKHKAKYAIFANNSEDITCAYNFCQQQQLPFMVLGEGSNSIFINDFNGLVCFNRIKNLAIENDNQYFYVSVGSGQNWHSLVSSLNSQKIYGLENLALIPGNCGAAPVQNIGAYGAEFAQFCHSVSGINLTDGSTFKFNCQQCNFAYRNSIFKQRPELIITGITLKIKKNWQANLSYEPLKKWASEHIENKLAIDGNDIFNYVCKLRLSKIPDPLKIGNAGSFFKNPIITNHEFMQLKEKYPQIAYFKQDDGMVKIACAWLIDHAGLKGFNIGAVQVCTTQPLVLTNLGDATSQDLISVMQHIQDKIKQIFNIKISPEVRFIGANGEVKYD